MQTLVFGAVAVILIGGLSSWAATSIRAGRLAYEREQSIQAAEAGIDYYRWHLAHAPADFQDGTGAPGPYVHDLSDKDGNTVGRFSLEIISPPLGSTLVEIISTGYPISNETVARTVQSRVAKPSIAKFAFAGHDAMRFGQGTEIFGQIHVNGGVRFDGLAHNIVTSSTTLYTDPDHTGGQEIGVHTHVRVPPQTGVDNNFQSAESNPGNIPVRPDVFEAGRLISQPLIDFAAFTTDLANLRAKAQTAQGFYRDTTTGSNVGYRVVLKTNDTFDLYRIASWVSATSSCNSQPTWSPNSQTLLGNYTFPANGIMFFEDNVVVEGQINTARLTIVAADLPVPSQAANYKNIIVNNNLRYTSYNGSDVVGLISQGSVFVGLQSASNLRIDAALIAQNGSTIRNNYSGSSCTHRFKDSITLFGMMASRSRYGFAWILGDVPVSGYDIRNIAYDANLLYAPPPDFPVTSDQYQILSWQEL